MDAKKILSDGVFCPMPWVGLMYNFDGTVKNCIRSASTIGTIKKESIDQVLTGHLNQRTQTCITQGQAAPYCRPCYDLERNKRSFDIVSDRMFYIRQLKHLPLDTYDQVGHHDLRVIDIRWTNLCNFACVYCTPEYSSKWAAEIGVIKSAPSPEQIAHFKQYVFDRVDQLEHVYLAGGEPLLMKENEELLDLLQKRRPDINLRINTNLSKVDTRIFDRLCQFPNVHWTVSVESMGDEFDYIRFGGRWQDFVDNLDRIQQLSHKITFNMLYFILNFWSFFKCVDFLSDRGFHANSFVVGAPDQPSYLNIRHLPDFAVKSISDQIQSRLDKKPGYLLEDSLRNILNYINQPYQRDLNRTIDQLQQLDQRRGLDSKKIFKDLYTIYEEQSWPNHLT